MPVGPAQLQPLRMFSDTAKCHLEYTVAPAESLSMTLELRSVGPILLCLQPSERTSENRFLGLIPRGSDSACLPMTWRLTHFRCCRCYCFRTIWEQLSHVSMCWALSGLRQKLLSDKKSYRNELVLFWFYFCFEPGSYCVVLAVLEISDLELTDICHPPPSKYWSLWGHTHKRSECDQWWRVGEESDYKWGQPTSQERVHGAREDCGRILTTAVLHTEDQHLPTFMGFKFISILVTLLGTGVTRRASQKNTTKAKLKNKTKNV